MAAKKAKTKKAAEPKTANKKGSDKGKTMAALSYLWIVGLIVLLTEKKNEFVRFHAKQATALFLIEMVCGLTIVLAPLLPVLGIVAIYGLVMAAQGKEQKIPLVYDLGVWFANLIKQ